MRELKTGGEECRVISTWETDDIRPDLLDRSPGFTVELTKPCSPALSSLLRFFRDLGMVRFPSEKIK